MTATGYLRMVLEKKVGENGHSARNSVRGYITGNLEARECVTLPIPMVGEEELRRLQEFEYSELRPEFRENFEK